MGSGYYTTDRDRGEWGSRTHVATGTEMHL